MTRIREFFIGFAKLSVGDWALGVSVGVLIGMTAFVGLQLGPRLRQLEHPSGSGKITGSGRYCQAACPTLEVRP